MCRALGRKVEAKDWRQRRHRAEVCGSLSCSSISSGSILQMLMAEGERSLGCGSPGGEKKDASQEP